MATLKQTHQAFSTFSTYFLVEDIKIWLIGLKKTYFRNQLEKTRRMMYNILYIYQNRQFLSLDIYCKLLCIQESPKFRSTSFFQLYNYIAYRSKALNQLSLILKLSFGLVRYWLDYCSSKFVYSDIFHMSTSRHRRIISRNGFQI